MIIQKWQIKRIVKNPKFVVITNCQGQPFYRLYTTIGGALMGYAKEYKKMHRYHTSNMTLREWLVTDRIAAGETE